MEPIAELLDLPKGYGRPKKPLAWKVVRERLEQALHYWVVTTRPDGRPHAVPRDGVWHDDVWYYGGSPDTVHHRNLAQNPAAVMHLEDGMQAVIVEGEATRTEATPELAQRLLDAFQKYAALGYAPTADSWDASALWGLRPRRVLAWMNYPDDATRFRFP